MKRLFFCWQLTLAVYLVGWTGYRVGAGESLPERLDAAVERGVDWLLAQQQPDGTWISTHYGSFKDPLALTPLIAKVLYFAPATPARKAAREKAAAYLACRVRLDGTIDTGEFGIHYPVYSASMAVIVLTLAGDDYRAPRDAWLRYLRQFQHTLLPRIATPADRSLGGWTYARVPPSSTRDLIDPDFIHADMSSTIFAVGALRFARMPAEDQALAGALKFIESLQNLPSDYAIREDGTQAEGDGGFFFSPDPARNKAGYDEEVGGQRRYRSYGSATADGLRGLIRCGLPSTHPRVVAARAWLERNFQADRHPGDFAEGLRDDREAFYFYYAWSVSHALNALNVDRLRRPEGEIAWAELLAAELIRRQRADGAWSNPANFMREDDPMLATPLALAALLIDRMHMTGPEAAGTAQPPVPTTSKATTAEKSAQEARRMTALRWGIAGFAGLLAVAAWGHRLNRRR